MLVRKRLDLGLCRGLLCGLRALRGFDGELVDDIRRIMADADVAR